MILERIAGERWSRVLPAWQGRTVALLAGGPSLTIDQFALVGAARAADRLRVIAINDSYLLAPWADVHYAADGKWQRWHTEGIDKPVLGLKAAEVRERWAAFPGQKCTIQNTADAVPDEVHVLRNAALPQADHLYGLSRDPRLLVTGRHGGFQAFNIATLAGAAAILLLGYDANRGAANEAHWHGDHPSPSSPDTYPYFRRAFTEVEHDIEMAGIRVVNCSMGSSIESFEKMPLRHALERFT